MFTSLSLETKVSLLCFRICGWYVLSSPESSTRRSSSISAAQTLADSRLGPPLNDYFLLFLAFSKLTFLNTSCFKGTPLVLKDSLELLDAGLGIGFLLVFACVC